MDGIERFFAGGDRAVLAPKRGAEISRETVEAALKEKRLKLEEWKAEKRERPKEAYVLRLEGAG